MPSNYTQYKNQKSAAAKTYKCREHTICMAERIKGVRDFIGREAILREETIKSIRDSYEIFGFEPLETPAIEYLSLFTDKSGEEIENQLYSFSDKKGEKLALRPEHTVSKLRVVSGDKSIVKPFKAYSIGNVWRYEDTSKGRYREFVQADIDVYGSGSIRYDAEVIGCIDFAFKKLGLSEYKIHINNRKVLQSLLADLGIGALDGIKVMREMDKIDKIGLESVLKQLESLLNTTQLSKMKDYLTGKFSPESSGQNEINELLEYLKDYGITNAVVDNALVRGIAYYDGNIFEFIHEADPFKGTIAGGGRYDTLSQKFDLEMPIVGAAIGFDRVVEILKTRPFEDYVNKYCVVNIDSMDKAMEIGQRLRNKGLSVDILLDKVSLSKALDYCNSKKIRYAVIVGSKDLQSGEITIRDLKQKKDSKVREDQL